MNGRFYYGAHKTKDLYDDYLGSGLALKQAIKKYGRENFKREAVLFCEDERSMFEAEKNLVDDKKVSDPLCYNMRIGGHGGKVSNYSSHSSEIRKQISDSLKGRPIHPNTLLAAKRPKSEEWKAQCRAWTSGNKSALGNLWVTDGIVSKLVKIGEDIPKGFRRGRIRGKTKNAGTKIWITDGNVNLSLNKNEPIPLGFWRGRKRWSIKKSHRKQGTDLSWGIPYPIQGT